MVTDDDDDDDDDDDEVISGSLRQFADSMFGARLTKTAGRWILILSWC